MFRRAVPRAAPYALDIDPERAGWTHCALRVLELPPGGIPHPRHRRQRVDRAAAERRLYGARAGEIFELQGRESVFSGVTDFAYVPRDAHAQIASGAGGRFALAGAKCERRLPARYGPAPEVPVELRGAGTCSRQVNNFAAAGVFDCDRLIAVEVLTPGGNWSSYPPHKHDEHRPGVESRLEEIYYFEIEGDGGLGYHRVSPSRPGGTDVLAEVRTGDTVLIPDGWHGPSIARARPRHVLPQRDGGAWGVPRVADQRPSRPRLDPGHLARPGRRPPAAAVPDRPAPRRGAATVAPTTVAAKAGPAAAVAAAAVAAAAVGAATGPRSRRRNRRHRIRGGPPMSTGRTRHLTVAQALIAFLSRQYTERDGARQRLINATWGIFGHGNVAGIGQALVESAGGHALSSGP